MPPKGWTHDEASRVAMRTAWIARRAGQPTFWDRVDASGDCWEWTGATEPGRYGTVHIEGRAHLTHRLAWELLVGPIPEGMTLDHLCRNTRCVNPDHLEPVSGAVNIRRGYGVSGLNLRKTHCPKGHPYDHSNTLVTREGHRVCRACKAVNWRNWSRRQRKAS